MIDFNLIIESLPKLLRGVSVTLQLAGLSICIGLVGGTILGLLHTSKNKFVRSLVSFYVTIFRGTPMLIQITCIYYVLPEFGMSLPAFWAAVVAIGMNSSAYISQIIRSGIASVSTGQIEAAQTLGLSSMQTTRYIVLPQAIRVILPALGNEFITLIKDSSLAYLIGVQELYKEGMQIKSYTYDALTVYFALGVIYLILTTSMAMFVSYLEKRMQRHAND